MLIKTQKQLIKTIKYELSQSQIDYKHITELIKLLEKTDELRRNKWNEEKFGIYNDIADKCFSTDDIPF
jgi:hypothetical protein